MSLLVAGGELDPNLTLLIEAARQMGVEVEDARFGPTYTPAFSWCLERGEARLGGTMLEPRAAFQRFDVFNALADPRPETSARALSWYATLEAWLNGATKVRTLNRDASARATAKPLQLLLARELGLAIPRTTITNRMPDIRDCAARQFVAKPVSGGDFCYALGEVLPQIEPRDDCTAAPAIIQNRLGAPEIRIYVIGKHTFAFVVHSASLDYRRRQDAELEYLPEPPPEAARLRMMLERLDMDFGAADFKTDQMTGELVFLELNSSPMFARFDQVAGGRLCRAMVQHLMAGPDLGPALSR